MSPLDAAVLTGRVQAVELLIKAFAGVHLLNVNGKWQIETGRRIDAGETIDASLSSEDEEFDLIIEEEPDRGSELIDPQDEIELSQQLHSKLTQSGFVDSRAVLQSAVADVLQEILRKRLGDEDKFVVGSFSEGWGNSLKTLNGQTDVQSDIDVLSLIPGQLYHLKGQCECAENGDHILRHSYSNGHIQCSGFASNPAFPYSGAPLRPAIDDVTAGRICRYPPIAPLQPHRASTSNIAESVLQSLKQDIISDSSPCHAVHAASPGRGGRELRVSTNFLEKRMLRSLTTLQGQLFVTLKYLVKKVICHADGFNVQGVKPYHVKTITFRMLEETPTEQWKPENLVSLTRRSLQLLLECVESSRTPGNIHGRIMEHFFLSDAALYLKGAIQRDESMEHTLNRIAGVMRTVVDQLPLLLKQFMSTLEPLDESGRFYFHPFQILPDMRKCAIPSKPGQLEYHEIYDVVRECAVRLGSHDCSAQFQESLAILIARLPDCSRTARETLRALACLKFGFRETAQRIVSQCGGHDVSRGMAWPMKRLLTEASVDFVWQYLRTHDSAWKFCFQFDKKPEFLFLSKSLSDYFPLRLYNYGVYFYLNFDALLWALRLELVGDRDTSAQNWIRNVTEQDGADEQELRVATLHASEPWQKRIVLEKLSSSSVQDLQEEHRKHRKRKRKLDEH